MDRTCFGIDPGIARMGYGIVFQEAAKYSAGSYGCLFTSPDEPLEARILYLFDRLDALISEARPDLISVERLYFGKNTTTAEYIFQIRGVVLLLAARHKIPVVQPKPAEVKMSVCGNGRAEKRQVQQMISRILNMGSVPCQDDAADALAIAVTGLALWDFNKKTKSGD
ncbi:MAG: crossover junction endodeoxyribonuclease RuvC [Thermovirgaceae bacterium]|nr:crossover junction endodeoxyribonuclease RuvC [Thermovirgaceae bacterium]